MQGLQRVSEVRTCPCESGMPLRPAVASCRLSTCRGRVVTLAHNSAGPKMDIVTTVDGLPTGYLATNEAEYAAHLHAILSLDSRARQTLQERARRAVSDRFSEESFTQALMSRLAPVFYLPRT